jgi:peroxiredoxin
VQDAGRSLTLSQFRGKTVVLKFWATWCPPCVEEMPSLVQMQQKLGSNGVEVVAVSIDDDEQAYRQFLKDHKVTLTTIRDPQKASANLYGTSKWPETYIIDRDGIVRRKFIGPQDWLGPEIIDFLKKL